jgi:hypothetical protein
MQWRHYFCAVVNCGESHLHCYDARIGNLRRPPFTVEER